MDLDLLAVAGQVYTAVMAGQWALVAALALVLVVFVLRKFVSGKVPFLASDAGGIMLAFVGSLGGAFATAFAAGESFSWSLAFKAAQVAFLAMGGYAALKKLVLPLVDALLKKFGFKAA